MISKPSHINDSTDESNSEYPIDGCNHLISTSLRDLNSQYKNLMAKKVEKKDLKKGTRPNSE